MFKKYKFEWKDAGGIAHVLEFFVNSKSTRGGFMHRACVLGEVPRLDNMDDAWNEYKANEDTLFKKRYAKVSFCNRTWEGWPGHDCLVRLWKQISDLKFVDMSAVCPTNPFDSENEPEHESMWEPDDLFDRFSRR